jgi:chloride channel 7
MSDNVIFFRPVEKVGTVVDVLKSCPFLNFPIVDTEDSDLLYGTISSNVLCALLKHRSFGRPVESGVHTDGVLSQHMEMGDDTFVPIAGWEVVQDSYPKYPSVEDIRISKRERDLWLDLRPYANRAPITVQETTSISVRFSQMDNAPVFSCSFSTSLSPYVLSENI